MKVIDLLDEQKHSNFLSKYENGINPHSNIKRANKGDYECFTDRELKDLMDVHRQTYKRVNGRVKRK